MPHLLEDLAPIEPPSPLRVLDGGARAFPEVLRRIDQAQRRIGIKAFLWHDDEAGNAMARAVLGAAERGVQVSISKDRIAATYEYFGGNKQSFFHKRIGPGQRLQAWFLGTMYKARGSARQKPNPLAAQILAHPNIRVTSRHKRFDHAKLFAFDDRVLVLGSMGIGNSHHGEWVDVMVELEGETHLARLEERLAGEVEFDPARKIDFLVHSHDIHPKRSCPMLGERLALIDSAQRSLVIEMAYLGDPRFTTALVRAVQRGVDVTLITAARANVLGDLNRATCDKLLARTRAPENLKIVLLGRMVHTKLVVIDGRLCDVGSANFTPLSHGVYEEINLYADDPVFARRLEEVALAHVTEGELVAGRLDYRRLAANVERVIVAFQARKGA
jgi:cardiolipin synthase